MASDLFSKQGHKSSLQVNKNGEGVMLLPEADC
jgi:hypothetical protein